MTRKLEITVDELADALEKWERASKEGDWPERSDADRHRDNAEYVFELICKKRGADGK